VTSFESVGKPFDPTRHDAVATVRTSTVQQGRSSTRRAADTCGRTNSFAPPACGSRNRTPSESREASRPQYSTLLT